MSDADTETSSKKVKTEPGVSQPGGSSSDNAQYADQQPGMAAAGSSHIRPPKPFSGKAKEEFKSRIRRLGHYFSLQNTEIDKKLELLLLNLDGSAYRTADQLGADRGTYAEAVKILSDVYIPPENKKEYRSQFATRNRKQDEKVDVYGRELRLLVALAYPDFPAEAQEELAIHRFIWGLNQPLTAQRIYMKDCKTLSEAVGLAKLSESAFALNRRPAGLSAGIMSVQEQGSSGQADQPSTSGSGFATRRGAYRGRGYSTRGGPPWSGQRREIRCYKCNQFGHMQRDCPEHATRAPAQQSASVGYQRWRG